MHSGQINSFTFFLTATFQKERIKEYELLFHFIVIPKFSSTNGNFCYNKFVKGKTNYDSKNHL